MAKGNMNIFDDMGAIASNADLIRKHAKFALLEEEAWLEQEVLKICGPEDTHDMIRLTHEGRLSEASVINAKYKLEIEHRATPDGLGKTITIYSHGNKMVEKEFKHWVKL
jgi:hypothetical protein